MRRTLLELLRGTGDAFCMYYVVVIFAQSTHLSSAPSTVVMNPMLTLDHESLDEQCSSVSPASTRFAPYKFVDIQPVGRSSRSSTDRKAEGYLWIPKCSPQSHFPYWNEAVLHGRGTLRAELRRPSRNNWRCYPSAIGLPRS